MPLITATATEIIFSTAAGADTLQAAVNRAQSTGLPLFIAPGTYTQASVTISSSVTIYARKESVILRSPTTTAFSLTIGTGPSSARNAGVVIRGINFDGENKAQAAGQSGLLQVFNADRFVVEDCFFWRSKKAGLYLYASEGRVAGNRCDNCVTSIVSVNSWGVSIEGNYLTNSLDNGIECYHDPWAKTQTFFDGATIHGNRIYTVLNSSGGEGQWGNAIVCHGLQYLRITDNLISNANFSAVRVDYCRDVVVSCNQVNNAREVAIFVENPADYAGGWSNVVISSNTLNGVGGGVVCANNNAGSRRASIVGNTIFGVKKNTFALSTGYNHVTHGVGIWLAADCIATGNVVEYAESAGIAAIFSGTWNGSLPDRNSVSAIVTDNILKYCDVGIGYSDDDFRNHCEIARNTIIGALSYKIVKMAATSLPAPAPAGNLYGPPAPVYGAPEMGFLSNAVSNRWSFDRNKIVNASV